MVENMSKLSSEEDASVSPLFRLLASVLAVLCAVSIVGVVIAWILAGFHPMAVLGLSLLVPGFYISLKVARSGYPPRWLMRL